MLYLMALQDITSCPFRVVDEINQVVIAMLDLKYQFQCTCSNLNHNALDSMKWAHILTAPLFRAWTLRMRGECLT